MHHDKRHLHALTKNDFLLAGSISGCISRAIVQPLDVLKIRFQLQVEPIEICATSKYHGVLHAIKCINQEEGLIAFWKGHVPAQLQAMSFSATQFLTFELLTSFLSDCTPYTGTSHDSNNIPGGIDAVATFVCGCLAGSTAATVTQPFDVLRTRFIAQGEPKTYRNITHAAISIATREGPQGFFRGLVPSLLLVTPQTGLQFALYHTLNQVFISTRYRLSGLTDDNQVQRVGPIMSLVSGGLAGMGSKTLIYPLDMIKKRMQITGFEQARSSFGRVPITDGVSKCFMDIWRNEGGLALFKGLRPSLLKSCLSISCRFTVYEQVCQLFQQYRHPTLVGTSSTIARPG